MIISLVKEGEIDQMTKMVPVTGNTYPIKDQIKALGGRWNGHEKQWYVPNDKTETVIGLLKNAGVGERFSGRSTTRSGTSSRDNGPRAAARRAGVRGGMSRCPECGGWRHRSDLMCGEPCD